MTIPMVLTLPAPFSLTGSSLEQPSALLCCDGDFHLFSVATDVSQRDRGVSPARQWQLTALTALTACPTAGRDDAAALLWAQHWPEEAESLILR